MKETMQLLSELMHFKPVTADKEAVNEATLFLKNYLEEEGIPTCLEHRDDRYILFASTTGQTNPTVLFNAHVDVVPAEENNFTPVSQGGWLYGRGSSDCLGNCAVIANTLIRLKGVADVGAVFSTDEEAGGQTTRVMAEQGYNGEKLICIMDGTGNCLTTAQKGVLTVTLHATGESCHAAKPWEGQNALDNLISGYGEIKKLFPDIHRDDQWHDTMAAVKCNAGTAHNRVPDEASMTLNIRYTEPGTQNQLLERMRSVSGLAINTEMECPPVVFEENATVFQQLRDFMEKHLDIDIPMTRMNGATDARHFASLGIPVAIIGVNGKGEHGDDEAVELQSISAYEHMLTDFLCSRR